MLNRYTPKYLMDNSYKNFGQHLGSRTSLIHQAVPSVLTPRCAECCVTAMEGTELALLSVRLCRRRGSLVRDGLPIEWVSRNKENKKIVLIRRFNATPVQNGKTSWANVSVNDIQIDWYRMNVIETVWMSCLWLGCPISGHTFYSIANDAKDDVRGPRYNTISEKSQILNSQNIPTFLVFRFSYQ